MRIYKARLIERQKRTPTVESFRFLHEKKIDFIPGQFLKVIFDEKTLNNKELNKYLSFSCSPERDYIEVTKRLSESQFSGKLRSLRLNDQISIQAPLGQRVFKEEYQKIAFLIGGIGITPVISILEYIIDKKLKTDVFLFYSNRTEEEIAFRKELDNWRAKNGNVKIFCTVTDSQPKDADCIFGRISKELVLEKIKDLKRRIFFIFGPPKMVEALKELCKEIGIAEECIKTESFIGY